MKNQELIKELLTLIQASTMPEGERGMWMLMIPEMTEEQLLKLKASLQKEINGITDLYLNAVSSDK